jgi:hypothetical protein
LLSIAERPVNGKGTPAASGSGGFSFFYKILFDKY